MQNLPGVSGIYLIDFKEDKVYVGSAVNIRKRYYQHLSLLSRGVSTCIKLQRAYNKYYRKFYMQILEQCPVNELHNREAYWIKKMDSIDNGYNIASNTLAPMLGRKHSKKTKKLMSVKSMGNKSNSGKIFTQEHKDKIAKNNKGVSKFCIKGKKLTLVQVRAIHIFSRYYTRKELCIVYNISLEYIGRILRKELWKNA